MPRWSRLIAYAALRSQPHPRPRPGLLAGRDHRRGRAAAGRRGSGARGLHWPGCSRFSPASSAWRRAFSSLGFITDLLSKPVRYGYVNGIALTVIVGQLPKLFGFSIDATGLIPEARAFLGGVRDGQTNLTALLIGLASLGHHHRVQARPAEGARGVGRRRRRDGRRWRLQPGGARRPFRRRRPAAGVAAVRDSVRDGRRHRSARGRSGRHRDRRLCRYERALAHVCPARRLRGGPRPGTGRAGRGQHGLGAFPGLRHQQPARRELRWRRRQARKHR